MKHRANKSFVLAALIVFEVVGGGVCRYGFFGGEGYDTTDRGCTAYD